MNLNKFQQILDGGEAIVCQTWKEWRTFLEIAEAYFKNRGIGNPIIVELGVENGGQKTYYKELMNGEHIGIDRENKRSEPDILGDALDQNTINNLIGKLAGRGIDLLFIDLWVQAENYSTIKQCYETYGKLTTHIIAIHSIYCIGSAPERLWREIHEEKSPDVKISIFNQYPESHRFHVTRMGIGMILKDQND